MKIVKNWENYLSPSVCEEEELFKLIKIQEEIRENWAEKGHLILDDGAEDYTDVFLQNFEAYFVDEILENIYELSQEEFDALPEMLEKFGHDRFFWFPLFSDGRSECKEPCSRCRFLMEEATIAGNTGFLSTDIVCRLQKFGKHCPFLFIFSGAALEEFQEEHWKQKMKLLEEAEKEGL